MGVYWIFSINAAVIVHLALFRNPSVIMLCRTGILFMFFFSRLFWNNTVQRERIWKTASQRCHPGRPRILRLIFILFETITANCRKNILLLTKLLILSFEIITTIFWNNNYNRSSFLSLLKRGCNCLWRHLTRLLCWMEKSGWSI